MKTKNRLFWKHYGKKAKTNALIVLVAFVALMAIGYFMWYRFDADTEELCFVIKFSGLICGFLGSFFFISSIFVANESANEEMRKNRLKAQKEAEEQRLANRTPEEVEADRLKDILRIWDCRRHDAIGVFDFLKELSWSDLDALLWHEKENEDLLDFVEWFKKNKR